jgi:hypothetical protein
MNHRKVVGSYVVIIPAQSAAMWLSSDLCKVGGTLSKLPNRGLSSDARLGKIDFGVSISFQ